MGKEKSEINDRIRPGREWLDTEGKRIEAHGGTMFYEAGVYYWLGEDKSHTGKKGKIWTWGIKLYASRDLYNWKEDIKKLRRTDLRSFFMYPMLFFSSDIVPACSPRSRGSFG